MSDTKSQDLPKLLIVEDDEGLQTQLKWAFEGFEVFIASTRDEALTILRAEMPPVVTLDLGLPPDPDGTSEGFAVLDAIMALVKRYQLHDKVVVTSASRTLLRYAKRSGFALPTGLVEEYGLLNPLKSARRYGCQYLILNWKLCNAERLRQAQAQGLHVSVWTVNDTARMQQLIDMGVDSLITDYPARAMEVSQGRG